MKTKKRILAYLLTFTLAMTSLPIQLFAQTTNDLPLHMSALVDTQTTTPGAIQINPAKYVGDGYEVEFKVTNQWPGSFNGEFMLTNTSNVPLENWTLAFDFEHEITNMWNAQIVTHEANSYIIKNQGYNQDIAPGSSVNIGFQASWNDEIKVPESYDLLIAKQEVGNTDYTIDFKVTSDWGQAFNGEISITNNTEETIEDWTLEFDFDKNIERFWTAEIVEHEGEHYIIKNAGYNANIASGQTITLGFSGNPGNVNSEPTNYVLNQLGQEIDYEKDTDEDGLPDFFEKELGTVPNKADTDGDGLPDGDEYFYLGTDPLKTDTDGNGILDGDEDLDEDKLTNLEEYLLGTDPYNEDTDGDNLTDSSENNIYGTNPIQYDTDGDTIGDGDEIKLGLNPLNKYTHGVLDNEYQIEQSISNNMIDFNQKEDKYQLSLDVVASGCVENNIYVLQSPYYEAMRENDAILGNVLELSYDTGIVSEATLKFEINELYVEDATTQPIFDDTLMGIKRYNIFKYSDEDNLLLPVETEFDIENNIAYAKVTELGDYCLIDLVKLMDNWGIEKQSDESLEKIETNGYTELEEVVLYDMMTYQMTRSGNLDIPSYVKFYNENNGNQYAIMEPEQGKTYAEAEDTCQLIGGHLATITTSEENNFIANLIRLGNKDYYWIGGTDEVSEGSWRWVTNEIFNYSNWSSSAPNNGWTNGEDYIGILKMNCNWGKAYEWNDFSNTGSADKVSQFGYICEWEKQSDTFQYVSANGLKAGVLDAPLTRYGTTNSDSDSLTDSQEVNWVLMKADGTLPTLGDLMKGKAGYVVNGLSRISNIYEDSIRNTRVLPLRSDPLKEDGDGDGLWDDEDPNPLNYNDFYFKNNNGKIYFIDERDLFFICNSKVFNELTNNEKRDVLSFLIENGTINDSDLRTMGYDYLSHGWIGIYLDIDYSGARGKLTSGDLQWIWMQNQSKQIENCIEFTGMLAATAQIERILNGTAFGDSGKIPGVMTKPGKLTGSLDGLKGDEKKMVNDLLARGKNVEIIPRSNVQNVKSSDFYVDGIKTELKTLNGTSKNTPVTRIQDGFAQGASTVILDARKVSFSDEDASMVFDRIMGKYAGNVPGSVEIWTNNGVRFLQ